MTDLKLCCNSCDDGTGNCAYPYYGVAPHECYYKKPGGFNNPLGTSTIEPVEDWLENFVEDSEAEGCGVYTHCLECGRPNNYELWKRDQEILEKRKSVMVCDEISEFSNDQFDYIAEKLNR